MRRLAYRLAIALSLLPAAAAADLVVVVHPHAGFDRLDRGQVVNIFLGRFRQLPSGVLAQPLDLPNGEAERARFYRLLVNKEPAEIASYWARLVFSGGTRPPRTATGSDELLRLVASSPGAIGYIDRRRVDSRVRIVYDFSD